MFGLELFVNRIPLRLVFGLIFTLAHPLPITVRLDVGLILSSNSLFSFTRK